MGRDRRTPSPGYLRAIDRVKENIQTTLANVEEAYSYDNYVMDYSLDSLNYIAEHDTYEGNLDEGSRLNRTKAYLWDGTILGEAIIRNLGGEWVYPSYARIIVFQIFRNIGVPLSLCGRLIFPRMQIRLKDKLIPVMKIGQLRIKWSNRVFSLAKAYEEIRTTGEWSGKSPATELEKYILKDKRQMRRIKRWRWLIDPTTRRIHTLPQFILGVKVLREDVRIREISGGDAYSPVGLRKIDESLSRDSFMDICERKGIKFKSERGERLALLQFYRGVGGYFGETIVRKLGGEWIYPSRHDFQEGLKKHDIEYLQDRCFVKVGEELIPVMKMARMRLKSEIPSLLAAYEEIKKTGGYGGKVHSSNTEKASFPADEEKGVGV